MAMMGGEKTDRRQRLARLLEKFPQLGVDAVLFFDMKNIRYLTGFTGSDGVFLLRPDSSLLLVDGRYITQAGDEAPQCHVVQYRDKIGGVVSALNEGEVRRAGFEAAVLTVELYGKLREKLAPELLIPLSEELNGLRSVKDDREVLLLRKAVDIASEAFLQVIGLIRPGVEERTIALEMDYRMRALGAEEASFSTIVASGLNAALPHARPGTRKIEDGDAVVMDFGAVHGGYRSDETCTFALGRADGKFREVYAVVKEAHDRAIEAVRAGTACREIDRIARQVIEKKGYGMYFTHGTGHGVGLDVHEAPRLSALSDEILAAGMVVTVEPGIYIPGLLGVRIEDMVLVQEDGCEIITKMSKELRIVP
jgi:Xaa-Pro aminopeptidase/Xaa-Pro dipeptidase